MDWCSDTSEESTVMRYVDVTCADFERLTPQSRLLLQKLIDRWMVLQFNKTIVALGNSIQVCYFGFVVKVYEQNLFLINIFVCLTFCSKFFFLSKVLWVWNGDNHYDAI
jgi:hypothetical protein